MTSTASSMSDSPVNPLSRPVSEGHPMSMSQPSRAIETSSSSEHSTPLPTSAVASSVAETAAQPISNAHKYGLKLFAGALAGAVSDLVMHPIDTVRARQQVHRGSNISFFYTAKRVVTKHGMPGLYRGIGATMLLTIPIHAIFYAGYEFLREGFRPYIPPEKQPINDAVSGCIAEFFSCSFGIPYEVIKQRAQVHKIQHGVVPAPDLGSKVPSSPYASTPPPKRAASSWNIAKTIYKEDGMRGFYRGTRASILVWCPFASLYFAVYEKLKLATSSVMGRPEKDIPTPYFFPAGMGAACVSALVTNPLDIVRTRLQTQGALGAPHAPGDPTGKAFTGRYDGIVDAFRKIYKTEGAKAFSKGLFARSIWIMPYTTIGIISYEYMKRVFNLPPDSGPHH